MYLIFKRSSLDSLYQNNLLQNFNFATKLFLLVVDPHFSHAIPLDQLDSFLFVKKIVFGKVEVTTYFILFFKGKIK